MDYTTNAEGHLVAATLTVVGTSLTLALGEIDVDLSLRDRDCIVRVTLRADEIEELANVLAEFTAALDERAGRS